MHGNAFYWAKKLNRFFVCYFCAISASYKTINIQWKPKEYEVHLYTIKICSVDCLNELSSEFLPLSAQNSITIQGKLGEMKTAWLIVCQQTALQQVCQEWWSLSWTGPHSLPPVGKRCQTAARFWPFTDEALTRQYVDRGTYVFRNQMEEKRKLLLIRSKRHLCFAIISPV